MAKWPSRWSDRSSHWHKALKSCCSNMQWYECWHNEGVAPQYTKPPFFPLPHHWNVKCCYILLMWSSTEPVNKAGDTLLSLACANGLLDTVMYLVNEHHCDPRSKAYNQLLHHSVDPNMYRYSQQGWWHPTLSGLCLWPLGHHEVPCQRTSLWS